MWTNSAVLNSKAPGVLFETVGDELFISYKNSETNGETYDVVRVEPHLKDPNNLSIHPRFRLNANYVVDFLDQAKGSVVITFAGDTKPVLFTNENFRYLIMPITG